MSSPTKVYSSKQEKLISSTLGWEVVTGSGARDFHPGDIISDKWMGECKTHTSPGHKIKFDLSVWKKICNEADAKFRYPVLFVDDGSQKAENTWCLFRYRGAPIDKLNLSRYSHENAIRTNIVFDLNTIKPEYTRASKMYDFPTGLYLYFNNECLILMPLTTFKEAFGDN